MIALVLAGLIAQDGYSGLGAVVQLPAPWEHIDVGNWTFISEARDDSSIILMQPGPRRGLVWVRYEYASTVQGMRSARLLLELNCEEQQTQQRQLGAFSQNNLGGQNLSATVTSGWFYAAPDTMEELALGYGCGD